MYIVRLITDRHDLDGVKLQSMLLEMLGCTLYPLHFPAPGFDASQYCAEDVATALDIHPSQPPDLIYINMYQRYTKILPLIRTVTSAPIVLYTQNFYTGDELIARTMTDACFESIVFPDVFCKTIEAILHRNKPFNDYNFFDSE